MNFESLQELVIDLDAFLTGKRKMAEHMMQNQADEFRRQMLEKDEFIYYLADGGMSRIVLKLHPNYESFCNPTVFFTSNSMPEVKERWNEEEAQDLIGEILELLFEPDQTMLEQFKKEVSDHATEVDPESEEDWHSLTIGWAIAKGLSPRNARTFAGHVRYNTDLA